MEEKSKQIQGYLQAKASPIIQPMLEKMAKQRPEHILKWIHSYINQKLSQLESAEPNEASDDQISDEEFKKKIERVKKTGKKNSRQGISAEVFGKYNKKSDFKPKIVHKSTQTQKQVRRLLEQSIFFQNLNEQDMQYVIKATEDIRCAVGQTVITEGEKGDALYLVASGQYECSKVIGGKQTYLKTYKTGEAFGELSLMYNAPRAATIVCKVTGQLFKLDRQTFQNIVQEGAIKKRNYYSKILSKVDILSEMDSYERDQICDALREEIIGPEEYVMKQGEEGDRFYIIAEGQLIAEKKQCSSVAKKVFQYKQGDYFGEIALIKNTVRQASIKTITTCRLVWIDRNTFKRLLGPVESILSRNMQKYRKIIQN